MISMFLSFVDKHGASLTRIHSFQPLPQGESSLTGHVHLATGGLALAQLALQEPGEDFCDKG